MTQLPAECEGAAEWNVLWFGADPTGAADSLPAIQAAIDSAADPSMTGPFRGPRILFPAGVYRCDGTLHVRRHVTLQGTGGLGRSTELRFPANTDGLRIEHTAEQGSGRDSVICDLSIGCIAQEPTSGDGIYATTQVYLERLHIFGFGGTGIHIVGDRNAGTNCNNSVVHTCTVGSVGGWAAHLEGQDANAVSFIACAGLDCASGGFFDASFLGGVFISCKLEGSANGPAFRNRPDGNSRTQLIGCYAEAMTPCPLYAPGQVLGGMGLLLTEDSNIAVLQLTSERAYQLFSNKSRPEGSTDDRGAMYWIGGKPSEQGVAYGFGPSRHGSGPGGNAGSDYYRQKLDGSPTCPRGWWEETWSNGLGPIRRSTSDAVGVQGGEIWFPRGYYAGAWGYDKDIRDGVTPVRVFVTSWHTRPDLDAWAWSGRTWHPGDRCLNSKPIAGHAVNGWEGWIYCAATATDPARWRGYGAIDAQ